MIEFDETQLESAKIILAGIPTGVQRAAASALNRAVDGARGAAVRKARSEYIITAKRIRDTMKINRASMSNLQASVVSRGRPIALSYFKFKPGTVPTKRMKNPVSVQVRRDGGGTITGGFVAMMKSGHVGVFNRRGMESYPIDQRYGPSAPQMLASTGVAAFVEQEAEKRLQTRLNHEIERLLRG